MRTLNKTSVYEYRSASRFLLDRVVDRQKAERGFSVRRWSKEMGFPSHSLLAMVLQGKRNLTLKQVPYLANGLKLSTPERMYFQALIQVENARTPEEKQWCEAYLAGLRPTGANPPLIREIDEYIAVADWIHPALLALSETKKSYRSAEEAIARIGFEVAPNEVRAALERLIALDLLEKLPSGKYRSTCKRMTSRDDVVNRGAREYHKQVSSLVSHAIETQDVLEREFQSMAVSVPDSKIALAKEMIRAFRTQFCDAMSAESGDQVYQMNMQFFRLTKSSSKLETSKEDDVIDSQKKTGVNHEVLGNA